MSQIAHALRLQYAVEMVAFTLNYTGVEAASLAQAMLNFEQEAEARRPEMERVMEAYAEIYDESPKFFIEALDQQRLLLEAVEADVVVLRQPLDEAVLFRQHLVHELGARVSGEVVDPVGGWRDHFDANQIAAIERRVGTRLREAFGYVGGEEGAGGSPAADDARAESAGS